MGNVVGIFSKAKRVDEPEKDIEGYLTDELTESGFALKSTFKKDWDQEANLWRLRVTVQHRSKSEEDMVFWYDGDNPQFAVGVPVGAAVSYTQADRVVSNG